MALLTDGMIYGGDAESAGLDPATNKSNTGKEIKKVLNQQVNVIGGITNTTKFTAEDNLGVVSDGTNNLKVRLAKDLQGISSILIRRRPAELPPGRRLHWGTQPISSTWVAPKSPTWLLVM